MPANAHLAGLTDSYIELDKSKLQVIYTIPNIELSLLPKDVSIAKGIKIYNAQQARTAIATDGKQLENIASQQFFIDYHCPSDLTNLQIHYSLLLNIKPSHKNHVRLSIAGRLKDFIFSADKNQHNVPIAYLLSLWHRELSDNNVSKPSSTIAQPANSAPYFAIGLGPRTVFIMPIVTAHPIQAINRTSHFFHRDTRHHPCPFCLRHHISACPHR